MISIEEVGAQPLPATVLRTYRDLTTTLDSARFGDVLADDLHRDLAVDRLYVIDGASPAEPLIAAVERGKPVVSGPDYVRKFLPWDPLNSAIGEAGSDGTVVRLRVTPADIVVPTYRAMLHRAAITERVSFIQRISSGWRCMTVARRRPNARFNEGELAILVGFSGFSARCSTGATTSCAPSEEVRRCRSTSWRSGLRFSVPS